MSDHQQIIDLTIAYCWAIDDRRFDDLRDVFVPNGVADYAGTEHVGIDAIISRCSSALSPLDASQHMVNTHQVAVDGDNATSRCYVHAQHVRRAAPGGANYIVAGVYDDRLVRTADGWRIAHRTLTVLWTEGNLSVVRPAPPGQHASAS
jgi:3-phenylpropionate/cinnamic acid dioxygenase small subunit